MKLSIILGVSHMLFGIILSYNNAKYFNKPLNVITEFIPQIIFLCSMFGYLVKAIGMDKQLGSCCIRVTLCK